MTSLSIALFLIFVLYLIDKNNVWRQALKAVIGIAILVPATNKSAPSAQIRSTQKWNMFTDGKCSVLFKRFDYVWVNEIERPILAAPAKYIQKIEQVLHSVQKGIQCIRARGCNS